MPWDDANPRAIKVKSGYVDTIVRIPVFNESGCCSRFVLDKEKRVLYECLKYPG
jgi:hypothetical protein